MASVFSRIVRGELPAAKVYEDDLTLAFLDINPASRGHTLVICKEEYPDLLDLPPELVAAVARTTQIVARGIKPRSSLMASISSRTTAPRPVRLCSTITCMSSRAGKATTPCAAGARAPPCTMNSTRPPS